jgi:hypothetical protein
MENGETWVQSEEWRPHLEKAMQNISAVGLSDMTPGTWHLNYYVDGRGLVTYKLLHQEHPNKSAVKRAEFVVDYLPLVRCKRERPVLTEGKIVMIRDGRLRDDGMYAAQVVLDEKGLPWPVPVAALAALARKQQATGGER